MSGARNKIREDTHFRVLRLLQGNPELSQRELAKAVGVSVGGMHYLLNALVDRGLIEVRDFTSSEDKRRCAYTLTPRGVSEKAILAHRFLSRKIDELEAMKAEIESLKSDIDAIKGAPHAERFGGESQQ